MGELAPGTVVAGYRIEMLIGRGGMGVVYRAVQSGLERVVALKVIAPELLDDEDVRRRFLSEARAAASVEHPNVIPVHDAGEDDGIAYIAMRYVDGDDLRTLVRRGGALDPAEAAHLIAQAGAALDAIHRAGFVHRDVKPANLLVDGDRHVYLTDFGLAKAVLTRTDGTRTGQWVGTLDYVAPEQIRGGRIDARADVYALGGVLHYALTGKVPFVRDGDEAKLWAQLSAPPPVPTSMRRGLRAEFDVAVARAMAKLPDERYPSAGDLGRAARAAALGRSPTEPERMVARGAAAPDAAPTEPGLAAEAETRTAVAKPPPPQPRRWVPQLAGGVLILVAAVLTLVLRNDPDPSSKAATDSTSTPVATATVAVTATVTPAPRPRRPRSIASKVKTVRHVGSRPSGIAIAGGDVWVMSPDLPRLTRVRMATGRERKQHPMSATACARSSPIAGASGWRARASARSCAWTPARDASVPAGRCPASRSGWPSITTGVWVGVRSLAGQTDQMVRLDRTTGERLDTVAVLGASGRSRPPPTRCCSSGATPTCSRGLSRTPARPRTSRCSPGRCARCATRAARCCWSSRKRTRSPAPRSTGAAWSPRAPAIARSQAVLVGEHVFVTSPQRPRRDGAPPRGSARSAGADPRRPEPGGDGGRREVACGSPRSTPR